MVESNFYIVFFSFMVTFCLDDQQLIQRVVVDDYKASIAVKP